jgi:23S rRNA pseudouridine1911/1915/1917 synthase
VDPAPVDEAEPAEWPAALAGALPDAEPEAEADTGPERREAVVSSAQHGERLDKVLVQLAPEFSRSHLQHLIDQGHVQLDGTVASTAARRLRVGQRVLLVLVPTDESQAFRPQAMSLVVLYEDEHLLVLDKPAGLVVHPAPGNWAGTLLNGLLARSAAAATLPRAGIVHRLDKDTSGVMVVGKTLPAVTALARAIAAREVHRRYLAIASGREPAQHFSIDAPIGRDPVVRVRMAVVAGGRASRTDVECLARRGPHLALACTLHTGRTHQIRVHLASRGLPLVADTLYGGKPALGLQRQALHATQLRFSHPLGGQTIDVHCEPPLDFAHAWQQLFEA